MEKVNAISHLKHRMRSVKPLEDEPEFHTDDGTVVRYLKSAGWDPGMAETRLLQTVEYRRRRRPLQLDCQWCHARPGFHSMRQVGHDEVGRPVVYANFSQAATGKNAMEDLVDHMTYLIENAKASMTSPGVTTWAFVIDCTGMTLSACSPKLGHGMTSLLSRHYPERLGLVICVNHNPVFHGVWKAVKGLITPNTAAKVRLVTSDSKIGPTFATYFSEELTSWLLEEIALNKRQPLPVSQANFWQAPAPPQHHDPRGCPTYIREYIAAASPDPTGFTPGKVKVHLPHPNIVDALKSKSNTLARGDHSEKDRPQAEGDGSAGSRCH